MSSHSSSYGAHNSRVVSARVPTAVHDAFHKLALSRGASITSLLRCTLVALSVAPLDGAKQLAAVAKALGLPPDASAQEVLGALNELLAALGGTGGDDAPPADPTAEAADGAPPIADPKAVQQLTLRQLDECRKHNVTPAEYVARRARIDAQWRRRT